MQIMTAGELNSYCRHLQLVGQEDDGKLQWIGTNKEWNNLNLELQLNELLK